MLHVYTTILSLHEEPKEAYGVCSDFLHILSDKSFWKERHEMEGLFTLEEENLTFMEIYYLTREFAKKETVFTCHLSKLPSFPSFVTGEEYYARALKFRREQIPQDIIGHIILEKCKYYYSRGYQGWGVVYSYTRNRKAVDKIMSMFEDNLGIEDSEHPSLDVSCKLRGAEPCGYKFYLYLDLEDEGGNKVDVPIESTLINMEQAFSLYLQLYK